jgi:hypothetical protein
VRLDELTHETFEGLGSRAFAIADPVAIELQLEAVTPGIAPPDGTRTPFSLIFIGPPEPLLPQAIYRLEHPELEPLDIFIVPVGRDADATRYEAIFA